jgi:hypothetical protein
VAAYRLAVDYGTSNTVAMLAWPDGRIRPLLFDGTPMLPSAVFAEPDGRLLTGADAVRSARLGPDRYEANPKRRIDDLEVLLGERTYPVEELIAAVLRRVGTEAVRIAGTQPAQLTLTCPVTWGAARQRVLRDAATRACLPAPTGLAEPVAATTYFATVLRHRIPEASAIVVYDLGGGTFDVSVVSWESTGYQVLAAEGLADLGGVDLDQLLIDLIYGQASVTGDNAAIVEAWRRLTAPGGTADLRHRLTLRGDARAAKETLSRRPSASLLVPLVELDATVTREEFERAARPLLERTVRTTASTIQASRVPMERIVGLFLVGGSTRTPLVASLLYEATGLAPVVLDQPELVVAEGALHATGLPAVPTAAQPTAPPAAVRSPPAVPTPAPWPPAVPPGPVLPAAVPPPVPSGGRRWWWAIGAAVVVAVIVTVTVWAVVANQGGGTASPPLAAPSSASSPSTVDSPTASPSPSSSPSATGVADPAAPPGAALLTARTCAAGTGLKSSPSNTQVNLTFVNTRADTVDLYWIDFHGNLVSYGSVAAHASRLFYSYPTHAWEVHAGSTCVAVFVATDASNQAAIVR